MGPCGYVTTAASTEKKLQEAQGGGHLPERGDQTLRPGAETEAEEASTAGQAAGHPTTRRCRARWVRSRAHGSQGRHERGPRSRNSTNVLCPHVHLVSDRTERKGSHFHLHIELARSADKTLTFSHFTKSSNAFLEDGYAESVPQPPARGPGHAWLT